MRLNALIVILAFYFRQNLSFTHRGHICRHISYDSVVCSRSDNLLHASPKSKLATERKTFKRFFERELWRSPELEDLYPILCSLESACRDVNRLMRRISTDNLQGDFTVIGNDSPIVNIQGEDQKKLDVIANRIFKTSLCVSGKVNVVASEEDDDICLCSEVTRSPAFTGKYAAVFDPMDGSSNIDCGLSTGTIFGVYKRPSFGPSDDMSTIQQKGTELLIAGYCLYSASTHLVLTIRSGVHQFTLDDVKGEFYLTRSNIRIPKSGPIYSINDANSNEWSQPMNRYITDLKSGNLPRGNARSKPVARYMGSLVADIHNILRKGGIFAYPAEASKPDGKLRLLYEALPIAMLVEEAGGKASSGRQRILNLKVENIHQRTPFFVGSVDQVTALDNYLSKEF